ncbi:unnamed protein product [Paramecium primaurelia]|uniref:Uncharacterized protein n=2 Tax=Paramecium TaxID=5884 RepID=A0A8S1XCC4_9CILI|nr:unnamed protein product [Paramecium primaurelia]CAD8198618.1 unnamed protein product [Paramecium pentaurelia]
MQAEKKEWPEAVGKTVDEAKQLILADDVEINVQVLLEGSPTTRDFRINRVRIFHNDKNIVVSVPRRG